MVIVSKNTPSPANSGEEVGNINTGASVEISMPFLKRLIDPLYGSVTLRYIPRESAGK